jgi:hypothetical protein
MRKLKIIVPPIVILAVSILIMLSGGFLKKPLGRDDDVVKYMNDLKSNIEASKWGEAEANLNDLRESWTKVEKRIQFSVERNDLNGFTVDLARIEGAIRAKSKESAIIELYEAHEHWEHLEK